MRGDDTEPDATLRTAVRSDSSGDVVAAGARCVLRRLTPDDQDHFIRLARESTGLHRPWGIISPTTPEAFATYLSRFDGVTAEGMVVCERGTGAIAGSINITNIVYRVFQSGSIGYAAFAPSAGKGYMSEGLGLAVRYAFEDLRLHRLEANIQPGNEASLRLARRSGFRKEGYSPAFLFLNGAWRDHERWAITREMVDGLASFPDA